MSELMKIRPLLDAAARQLAKATSAAEVLDARQQAAIAYSQAKTFARMAKIRKAHDSVLNTCRQMQADALRIENAAQCRLANEYDAAQERGEVKGAGQPSKSNIPNRNNTPTVTDIGLTSKQVHEARIIRDAEKKDPGIVKRTLDARIAAGEEPTRADIMRAAREVTQAVAPQPTRRSNTSPTTKQNARKSTRGENTPKLDRARKIISDLLDAGTPFDCHDLARDHGDISHVTFDMAKCAEVGYREGRAENAALDPSHLGKTAQERLDAAMRAHKRRLDDEFSVRVQEECLRRLNDISLPHYAQQLEKLEESIRSRKGVMDRVTYRKILACLHPDRVTDAGLKKRYEEAFRLFTELEKCVLDEKESPTQFRGMPRTYEELMAMRAKMQAERRAQRQSAKAGIRMR